MVVCNLGINDLIDYQTKHDCGLSGTFGERFISDYKELISYYQSLDTSPKILVWGPLAPLFPGQRYYGSPIVDNINRDIAQAVWELNESKAYLEIAFIDMFAPLLDHGTRFRDKLHPNKVGANIIAEIVFGSLQKHLVNELV